MVMAGNPLQPSVPRRVSTPRRTKNICHGQSSSLLAARQRGGLGWPGRFYDAALNRAALAVCGGWGRRGTLSRKRWRPVVSRGSIRYSQLMHPPVDSGELEIALDRAAAFLRAAQQIAVLTGAGVSAESGVPTFRGAGG